MFQPQFHGREHVNVNRWLRVLRGGCSSARLACSLGFADLSTSPTAGANENFTAALDYDDPSELADHHRSLSDGLTMFEDLFGFRSNSFMAPCHTWHETLEPTLAAGGIRYLQGARTHREPRDGGVVIKRHRLGERNSSGQIYLTRNCDFEPSYSLSKDWVGSCLMEMAAAFFWGKPAVICSHRLNFSGSIDTSNRTRNLKLLDELFRSILRRWPDVEFFSTPQLGDLIANAS
jgi:hypothetical protein